MAKKKAIFVRRTSKLISGLNKDIIHTILPYLNSTALIIYLTIVKRYYTNIIPPNYAFILHKPTLASRISTFTDITRLRLSFMNEDVLAISNLTNLQELVIKQNKSIYIDILDEIGTLSKLQRLALSGLKDITYLSNLTNLTYLDISNDELPGSHLSYLSKLTKLTALCISGMDLEDYDMLEFKHFPLLQELDISYCRMDDESLKSISQITTLTRLVINSPIYHGPYDDGHDSAPRDLNFLLPLSRLTSLSIRDFKIKDQDLVILTTFSLTVLDISCCKNITTEGLQWIGKLTTLTMLSLAQCNITGVHYLKDLTNCIQLDISNCKIGPEAIKEIFSSCRIGTIRYFSTF